MKTETLDRIINLLSNVASDDATRYHLNCIESTPLTNNKVLLKACDGHILSQCEVEDGALFSAGVVYIHREHLAFLKLVKKSHRFTLPCVITKNSIEIEGKEIVTQDTTNYPKTDALWPKGEDVFEVCIDAELLLNLVNGLKEDRRQKGAHLVFKNGTSGIQVYVGESKGLLMPMRITPRIKQKTEKVGA